MKVWCELKGSLSRHPWLGEGKKGGSTHDSSKDTCCLKKEGQRTIDYSPKKGKCHHSFFLKTIIAKTGKEKAMIAHPGTVTAQLLG